MTQEQHQAMFKEMTTASCTVVGWDKKTYISNVWLSPKNAHYWSQTLIKAKHEQVALSLMLDLYT